LENIPEFIFVRYKSGMPVRKGTIAPLTAVLNFPTPENSTPDGAGRVRIPDLPAADLPGYAYLFGIANGMA